MSKYRISNCGSKSDWIPYFQVTYNAQSVPMLDKEFLDDNIETALKQAFCIIMDYLKTSSLEIQDIRVEDKYDSNLTKYIIFKHTGRIQNYFKLEKVNE